MTSIEPSQLWVELGYQGPGDQVTRFVCVHYTQLGKSDTIQVAAFFWVAAINRHIATAQAKPLPVTVLRAWWAIVRCQSRSGRWTSWPGPAPSIRHPWQEPGSCAGTLTEPMYTNFLDVPYPVFSVCTFAVQRWGILKLCRRLLVRFWCASRLIHTSTYQHIPAHTSTYQHIPAQSYQYIPVCTGMCWYMLIYTGMCLYRKVCPSVNQ